MLPLLPLDSVWILVFCVWPLCGVCSDYKGPPYDCGNHGVQMQVPPGYLGGNISLLVRDEFGMAYGFSECVIKCVFVAQKPNGETIIYVSYSICISFREEGAWILRVRLVGITKSEDFDLICPKWKRKPRVIHHTLKPRGSTFPTATTLPVWTSLPTNATMFFSTSYIQEDDKVRTKSTTSKDGKTKEPDEDLETLVPSVHPSEPQIWTSTFVPTPTTKYPGILNESQCIVPSGRIPCLNSSVSRDTCLRYSCCHDPKDNLNPCYYGHTVTIDCSSDGSFDLVISRYITSPPLKLTTVVLGPGSCPPSTIIGDFLVAKGQLLPCATRRIAQGQLIYDLSITAKQDSASETNKHGILAVITHCPINITLILEPSVSPSLFPSVTNSGVLDVELRISKDSSFLEFYISVDYPLVIVLRDLIYFEVRLLQPSDPRLHLRLHNCWGAPDLDPATTIRWPLFSDGCPYTGDDPMTQILPGDIPSSFQRFAVSAFTFLETNSQVYVLCSISVCVPSPFESCRTDCTNSKRGRRFEPDSNFLVTTTGPLIFQQEVKSGLSSLQYLAPAFPGILLAVVLLLLLCLVGSLKLIAFTLRSRGHIIIK